MADKKKKNAQDQELDISTLKKTMEPGLVMMELFDNWSKGKGGIINGGEAICNAPPDQRIVINPTTPMGHGNLLYAKLTYTMPKYWYNLEKMDEFIVVSPSYPEMYGRIISKKRELEGQLKAGLASAAQAVADFELLKHDERKYREIMDYFNKGREDEHVLRALFVDRVDAHTGEGYSMISMTKRWPTIITDFLRLSTVDKKERNDIKKVREKLEIPQAEATVLKTKNDLFIEWCTAFFPDIRDRYVRIKTLTDARRKSIDEYREWLKPYVSNLKMLKEQTEVDPALLYTKAVTPWMKPNAWYGVRLWMWKAFSAEEVGKPGLVSGEIKPYDDFVKREKKAIEERYEIRIVKSQKEKKKLIEDEEEKDVFLSDDDIIVVDDLIKKANVGQFYEKGPRLSPDKYYYAFYDLNIISPLFKMEAGKEEVDDWNADITPYLVSQNVVLMCLLEVEAKHLWLNKYVKELIGVREVEDKLRKAVMKRYPGMEEKEPDEKKGIFLRTKKHVTNFRKREGKAYKRVDSWWVRTKPKTRKLTQYFVRGGPYESISSERLSKMWGRYMGSAMTDPLVRFIKTAIGNLSGVQPP